MDFQINFSKDIYSVEAYMQTYSITKFYPYTSENTLKLKYLDNGKYYAAVNKN